MIKSMRVVTLSSFSAGLSTGHQTSKGLPPYCLFLLSRVHHHPWSVPMAACWGASAVCLAPASTLRSQGGSSRTATGLGGSGGNLSVSSLPEACRGGAGVVGSARRGGVVCMAPEEQKVTRRSPLDFPIEWERPKPGRRPDIFPKFSPMKTPLPTPMPADPPPDEDEEEEEEKEEEEPEKEEEETEKPEST